MLRILPLLAALFLSAAAEARIAVRIDAAAAERVLAALRDPGLTREEALAIARLPGNQGLIRKAHSYGRPADEALLADALLAAAQGRKAGEDDYFGFNTVRQRADRIAPVLESLKAPPAMAAIQARIAAFAPPGLDGQVVGYLVAGGSSGGFSFDAPEFFLDLAHFPSAPLAATITEHELYHAVQNMAAAAWKAPAGRRACLAAIPAAERLEKIFGPLAQEGTAAFVGDVMALPAGSDDAAIQATRGKFERGLRLVDRSLTLLALETHAVTTGTALSDDRIYGLGFYGDEILYGPAYLMAKAIAAEDGTQGIARLIGKPGALFVERYTRLKAYGGKEAPRLDPKTAALAARLARCA